MKTRGLSQFFYPVLLAAMMGGKDVKPNDETIAVYHSHGTFHKTGKFKGYMRENIKCTFNKNK
jgi:hypothetical protein